MSSTPAATDSKEISLTDNQIESGNSAASPSSAKLSSTTSSATKSEGKQIGYTGGSSSSGNNNNDEKGLSDMISDWYHTPGKLGTYMSYALLLVGMIGGMIGQSYASNNNIYPVRRRLHTNWNCIYYTVA